MEASKIPMNNLVLIIDDDSRNIFALRLVLKARGYAVISANNVPEGLRLIAENPQVSVVLMDMMIPEMDGYTAIRMIREQASFAEMPIIAVTAQAMSGDREKCIAAGANGYVSKPVDIDKLVAVIEKVC